MDLFDKYNLIIINGKRCYKYDLNTKLPVLDHTIPYRFSCLDFTVEESTWGKMAVRIVEELNKRKPLSRSQLLDIRYDWSNTAVFSESRRINYAPCVGLYLNVNHTATHSMMSIQTILKEYGVDNDMCEFLICRHHVVESIEIKNYFRQKTIDEFTSFLKKQKNSAKRITTIINNFRYINKVLQMVSDSFDDFFIFDSYPLFQNYKISVNKKVSLIKAGEDNVINAVAISLKYLDDFYRNKNVVGEIDELNISEAFIATTLVEAKMIFDNLSTDVITIGKLHGMMNLKHSILMNELKSFNDEENFFKICNIYLGKKLFFKYPYILKSEDSPSSSLDILKEYIYKHSNITVAELNEYVDDMVMNHPASYFDLFDSCSRDYVLVDKDRIISVSKFKLPDSFIASIRDVIEKYIENFGSIYSETFVGYSNFPSFGLPWSKFLLLGMARTFMKDYFLITYLDKNYTTLKYKIDLL